MKRVCVIDGQGGGIGSLIIKSLKERYGESIEIIALGTNSIATSSMMRAKANKGATGENAICYTVMGADVIIGPISIIMANSMMGELTPRMAEAIATSPGQKILLPISQERVSIIGILHQPLPHMVEELVDDVIKEWIDV